jgi:hypothetical protein
LIIPGLILKGNPNNIPGLAWARLAPVRIAFDRFASNEIVRIGRRRKTQDVDSGI